MSWLSRFVRVRPPRGRRAPQPRPRCRPWLEALEERTLLSLVPPVITTQAPIVTQLAGEGFSTVPPTGPADQNPYGVAFVPPTFPTTGTLQPGDLLIANFNDPNNVQGTGTTITRITPQGQRSTFFTSALPGLDTGLVVLKSGFVIVANVPNDGNGNVLPGALQVLDGNGNLVTTLTNSTLLKDPWDLAVNDLGNFAQVFASNVSGATGPNGTVTRVDLQIQNGTPTVLDEVQVASGYSTRLDPAAFVIGPGGLVYDPTKDVLYVAAQDELVNGNEVGTIFAVPGAGTTTTDHGKGSVVFADPVHLHGPIGLVQVPNGDLVVANSDAVNTDPNQPSTLVEFTPAGQFVNQLSLDPNNGGAFGLGVTSSNGQVRFAATNDNQSIATVWNFVPTFGNPYVVSTVPPTGPAEQNPYGIAFVPPTFPTTGTLQPGDILVANFNDANNVQGTGTTIVRVTPTGQRSVFFASPPTSLEIGLDTGLVVLKSGFVIVANVPNDGNGNVLQGSLQVLDSNGNLVETLTDPTLLKDPWDLTVNDLGSTAQVFVSNVSGVTGPNGTVTRLDLQIPNGGIPQVQKLTQIASGYSTRLDAAAFVIGPGGLAYDPTTGNLYVAAQDELVNGNEVGSIFAIPNAAAATTDHGKGSVIFADPNHLHGPIGLVLAPNGDLITANSDAVNTDPAQPSTLVEFTPGGQFVGQFSVDPNNGGAFGLNLAVTNGLLRFAWLNDNQSTLSVSTFQLVSPVLPPTITSLSPSSAREGAAALTLTVNGSNFTSTSVVLWNGSPLATTFQSSSVLTATVPASLLADERQASVTVSTPGTGTSNALSFTVTENTPTLTASATGTPFSTQTILTISFTDSTAEGHGLVVDWGDGTHSRIDLGISAGGSLSVRHTFAHVPHRSIVVYVTDDEGTPSNTVVLPPQKQESHPHHPRHRRHRR